MPLTGYNGTTPTRVLLGPAMLYVGGVPHSASTVARVEFLTEWARPEIDGLSTPIAGMDIVVARGVRLSGTFLELGATQVSRMMHGDAGVVAGALTTYSGRQAGTYLPNPGGYLSDVELRIEDGAGNLHAVDVPLATVVSWPAEGEDRAEVGVALVLEARSTVATAAPYTYTITGAEVPPAPVATVAITPDPIAVTAGTTAAAIVRTYNAGAAEVTGRAVTAVVTNTALATVSPASGVSPLALTITGVAAGATVLTATSEGVSDTSAVDVAASGPILSDTFTRADSPTAPGGPETGAAYETFFAGATPVTYGIRTNRLYPAVSGSGYTYLVSNCTVADGVLRVKVYNAGNSRGITFRLTTATSQFSVQFNGGTIELYKQNAGAYTVLGSAAVTWVSGDELIAELSGSSIIIKQNTTTRITATDAFNSTATRHGVVVPGSSAGTAIEFDDLSFV